MPHWRVEVIMNKKMTVVCSAPAREENFSNTRKVSLVNRAWWTSSQDHISRKADHYFIRVKYSVYGSCRKLLVLHSKIHSYFCSSNFRRITSCRTKLFVSSTATYILKMILPMCNIRYYNNVKFTVIFFL